MFPNRLFCIGILLLSQTVVFAQSKLDSLQILDEVVVVGNRHRAIIPAQRLSGEKLEALSSFSVADAIRFFSGVQIKDFGGIGGMKTVNIRSMGSHHVGVFYDGIRIGNAQNGVVDLGRFSLDNIEEISLYNGQRSRIFQSAKDFGSAGTIYLRTRRPRFSDNKRTNIVSHFRTGSFHLVNPSVLWQQKINDNISYSFNAEFVHSSGEYSFRYRRVLPDGTVAWDTTAIRQNGDIRALRIESDLHGYTKSNGRWHGKVYFYDSERGIPGAIVNNVWKHHQRQWDRSFFTQFSAKNFVPLHRNHELLFNVKYAYDWMRYLNPDTTLMFIDNTFRQQEIYVSVANKYSILPNWDVNLAVDYQWNTLSSNMRNFVFPTRNTVLTAFATAFEYRRFQAQASILGTFVFESVPNVENKQEFTPAVFFSYRPFRHHNLNLRAFYKRIFRMPTFNDLYYTDIGNIALNPEYTNQYNFGFQYSRSFERGVISHLNFRADAYYNQITDKIVAIPKGNSQYRWMMMNLGYVEIRGIDVAAQIGALIRTQNSPLQINFSLNYTFQRAQDFTDNTSPWYGGQIAYIPWHSGSAIANIAWRTWNLNYSFIYVGERYHNSANIRANHEQPWYTHDLTISRTFQFRRVNTRIAAEINNIFNQQYDVVLNYPMPGRNYRITLRLEI